MNEQEMIQQEAQLIEQLETLEITIKPLEDKSRLGIASLEEIERCVFLVRDWLAARRQLKAVESLLRFG